MIDLTIFKRIPGFEKYMISEEGLIYSTVTKRLLKINLERFKNYKRYSKKRFI